ncbi:MAG: GNAT family N-acetyltransferase [archaeon GB-1867-097]|nr:GNAT family N-acetyltransferase [Candidatus Culexmicrobium thermophilum]MCS7384458.1 GNAT family N-acetyltransferase [Candidatus Culexmicrobium thermophilum]
MRIVRLAESPEHLDKLQPFLNLYLERDFITKNMFKRVLIDDPNMDYKYVYLAFEGEELIGILIGVRRISMPVELVEKHRRIGWIKALAVKSDGRGMRAADEMLEEFEEDLLSENRSIIRVSDFASWHITAGLDIAYQQLFKMYIAKGFRKVGTVVDYEVDLEGFKIPEYVLDLERKLEEENYRIYKPTVEERREILNWIGKVFSPLWAYEAGLTFNGEEADLWIARLGEKIVGFSAYSALEANWFGPIGVDSESRRLGIGTVLLYKSLLSMRLMGYKTIIIPWTDHLKFYTQLSRITGVRHYLILEKRQKHS